VLPRWQIAWLVVLVLVAVAADLILFPNSYAHAYLWGECRRNPMPQACTPRYSGSVGGGGMAHAP
jgi:hypothetical protein